MLQIVRPRFWLPSERRWRCFRTAGSYSVAVYLRAPWGGLTFYRPRRVAVWRWICPSVHLVG